MSTRRLPFVLVLVLAQWVSGCDSGPSGPGTLDGVVSGDATLGAVVLEVRGPSIEGFDGQGDTRAYGARLEEGRHRVILVHPTGGELRFGIRMRDRGVRRPEVTVVSAAGTDNRPRPAAGIDVRVGG